jgi:hypothetical protein
VTSRDELLTLERESLTAFVQSCSHLMTGRVLDYGCGKQPYRHVVEAAGGEYVPFDRAGLPGGSGGNIGRHERDCPTILCTQVIQYVESPRALIDGLREAKTVLILTGPTCWIEPPGHLHNLTLEGIRRLLVQSGFTVERLESRGHVPPGFSIGYGAVARA